MTERVPVEVFPPGEYIRDELEERGWTQNDLAEILGRPTQLVNEVVLGKRGITPETAKGLAEAFGTSAQLWLNLEAAWELHKSRNIAPDPAIALRARIYSAGPIKEMVKRGWLEYSTNPEVLAESVRQFFGISNLHDKPAVLLAAARMSTPYYTLNRSQIAWICRAKHLAQTVPVTAKFDPTASPRLIEKLQSLLRDPEEIRHVPRVLANWGIRFLVLEHLAGTRIDGACLWLDERSPVIVVSLRYDRIDYFWFTVMHELEHALNGDGLRVDIALVGEDPPDRQERPEFERKADSFAEDVLIPREKLDDFIRRKGPLFSETSILGFAGLHQVHPGLVVGQLHHRREVGYSKFRHLLVKIRDRVTQSALTDGWGHSAPVAE